MNTFVIGAATTNFGELWHISPRDLALSVMRQSLISAGIKKNRIDALFVGNMLSGILGGQEHLGSFFTEELGLSIPAFKIEGACASGGLAVHNAVNSTASGQYRTVLVLGIEKMTDHKPEDVAVALMGAGSDEERVSGVTFPGLYALIARAFIDKYQITEKMMAAVSVKNHYHASFNKKAQYRNGVTINQVLNSTKISDPLKLLDCSPISDGASCVIVSSDKSLAKRSNSIRVLASEISTDTLGLSERSDLTKLAAAEKASSKAYKKAELGPKNINVAEVHDCFSIAEIIAMEDLGFYKRGKAGPAMIKYETMLGKAKLLVVNPSGGLKACGHPVGATGVKQVAEIFDQLTDDAGARQVKNAKVGLTHNVGGSGATAVVSIFRKI